MVSQPFAAIDHVQLAMPKGEEETALGFYCGVLGMSELSKPTELAKRGGCWFASGRVQIHLGIENNFRPAKKTHPALRCGDYALLTAHLQNEGVEIIPDDTLPGTIRCYIHDPFGNRIELIAT